MMGRRPAPAEADATKSPDVSSDADKGNAPFVEGFFDY
jgi:hypothetical protein